MTSAPRFTNRLIQEKSPYLLQHAHNPVDWYPWGPEAFEKAKREDKPLLVSIGYATCHWCHVMEHESFENEKTANYLNQHFVAIKIDREERPDLDKIYMDALQATQQQGGWPLNMFVTPEGWPVTGGTYFPPEPRYGRNSFLGVLQTIVGYWQNERGKIYESAHAITEHLKRQAGLKSKDHPQFDWTAEEQTLGAFAESFDGQEGGFQWQPQNKFPPSMGLMFLLRHYRRTGKEIALEMVELTLQKMHNGGIYDQVGGGLSRYSTDYEWLVPHFEKMLYDNALFIWAALEAYQVTGKAHYREIVEDVIRYIGREMRSPEGAFYSAEDADSEGEEGKFYVWEEEEVIQVLGPELGRQASHYWGIVRYGNFEHGRSILHQAKPLHTIAAELHLEPATLAANLAEARQRLLAARSQRIRPLLDDKILTSWNGLMISALARSARVLERPDYGDMASQAAHFIWQQLITPEGRLLRRYRQGEARFLGYLCDYAQMATACLDLYEYDYNPQWLQKALWLAQEVNRLFRNENGPYYDTGSDAEVLITRNMEGYDGVEPSGNSTFALVLLKLAAYGFPGSWEEDALRILSGFERHLSQAGINFTAMHWGLHFWLSIPQQVVICGERGQAETEALLQVVRQGYYPNLVTVFRQKEASSAMFPIPVAEGRQALNDRATAYVCQNQTCQLPVHTPEALRAQLPACPQA